MKLKLVLIYSFITFFSPIIIKSEDVNSNLEEVTENQTNLNFTENVSNDIHLVKEGDTLSSISKLYSIDIKSIMETNNLSDENYIFIGQKLLIPESIPENLNTFEIDQANFHEIQKGETLTDISLIYGIKLDKLIKLNKLENANSINIGTKILLEEINTENAESITDNGTQNLIKEYGPLKVNSQNIKLKNKRKILEASNQNGESIIISLNCEKEEIDVRAKGRRWKGSLPAKQEFEKNLIKDFC